MHRPRGRQNADRPSAALRTYHYVFTSSIPSFASSGSPLVQRLPIEPSPSVGCNLELETRYQDSWFLCSHVTDLQVDLALCLCFPLDAMKIIKSASCWGSREHVVRLNKCSEYF